MQQDFVKIEGIDIPVISLNTVIVGTGCAGYNAADSLYDMGQKDIAIVTQGINMGTSRNTGSDKQTYYKLAMQSDITDSVIKMADTLFAGGSMHGDIALIEAALSAKSFYKLVEAGVPFPHNEFGEYVGYKTDHDASKRATSAGPLTSKYMTQKLQKKVEDKGIRVFDGYRVVKILTTGDEDKKTAKGIVAIDLNSVENENLGITIFNCTNIIYATGGPAGMYKTSVYPESQTGASGVAFEAGVKGANLTESQYGIASTKFRWNLSGSYQQVIPRYVSTNQEGRDEREFLDEYFSDTGAMLSAIFLKGYEWPFDPRKIKNEGSSLIDILVYKEMQIKGRRVFLDFTKNPASSLKGSKFDFSQLKKECYEYLENSDILFGTPLDRLKKINKPAYDLYKNNGIDLAVDRLEIAVCAQHNNGGLQGDIHWESNVAHFFPVGEVNGTFGVYRPGGSALNSTQVGSYRAAQYIANHYVDAPQEAGELLDSSKAAIVDIFNKANTLIENMSEEGNVFSLRNEIQQKMSANGAHIRSHASCKEGIEFCKKKIAELFKTTRIDSIMQYPEAFINYDILLSQLVYLNAICGYIEAGGKSRGSYLITDDINKLEYNLDGGEHDDDVFIAILDAEKLACDIDVEKVRAIPKSETWFEKVWNDYMKDSEG